MTSAAFKSQFWIQGALVREAECSAPRRRFDPLISGRFRRALQVENDWRRRWPVSLEVHWPLFEMN